MDVNKFLIDNRDEKYRQFQMKLISTDKKIIGVRMPMLKTLAKEIAKGDYEAFFKNTKFDSYEQMTVYGLAIGYIKEQPYKYIKKFVPFIDNWSTCDSFCSNLKFIKKDKERFFEFLVPYIKSEREFEKRFAVVCLLDYFIDDEYILKVLDILDSIKSDYYYVKMAVAWALSVCYVKYRQQTDKYLENSNLDAFTYNKTISKICDSLRVSKEDKYRLREKCNV